MTVDSTGSYLTAASWWDDDSIEGLAGRASRGCAVAGAVPGQLLLSLPLLAAPAAAAAEAERVLRDAMAAQQRAEEEEEEARRAPPAAPLFRAWAAAPGAGAGPRRDGPAAAAVSGEAFAPQTVHQVGVRCCASRQLRRPPAVPVLRRLQPHPALR